MIKIERTEKEMNGRWTLSKDVNEIGKIQYRWLNKSKFDIFSTVVEKEFEEEGFGIDLLTAAVNYARANQKKISATCSFAKDIFEKNAGFTDVYEKN
jgi:predicted GNAT family acetyltransferase